MQRSTRCFKISCSMRSAVHNWRRCCCCCWVSFLSCLTLEKNVMRDVVNYFHDKKQNHALSYPATPWHALPGFPPPPAKAFHYCGTLTYHGRLPKALAKSKWERHKLFGETSRHAQRQYEVCTWHSRGRFLGKIRSTDSRNISEQSANVLFYIGPIT